MHESSERVMKNKLEFTVYKKILPNGAAGRMAFKTNSRVGITFLTTKSLFTYPHQLMTVTAKKIMNSIYSGCSH